MQRAAVDQPMVGYSRRSSPSAADAIAAWFVRLRSAREYFEVVVVVAVVTVLGWYAPFLSYRAWGHIYLLAVILLCARVGRGAAFFAAIVSAVAWNYVIVPPRMSFSVLHVEDGLILGTYFVVALIAGQLTTTIRAQKLRKTQGEQRALALFHLTRALAAATTLDEAVEAALRQADDLFAAKTALLVTTGQGSLTVHPASSHPLSLGGRTLANWAATARREVGRFTMDFTEAKAIYVPILREQTVFGVFIVAPAPKIALTTEQRDLTTTFAAQIAMLIERERLRDAGAHAKIVAESDRLRRTLLDSVSHELKTPLAVLRSAAEGVDTPDASRRVALADEIRTATQRLDRLVANLLNQTRLESGAVRPLLAPCDVRDLIAAARRMMQGPLADRTIQLAIPAELPLARADAQLMEHVLGNLLLNAATYSPRDTPILLSAGLLGESQVAISVSDRGPGIPPELSASLFEKFQRGKDATAGGVGLGLAIVRGFMVAQHGGVTVGARPGGGARFTVFLPAWTHEEVPVE